MPNAPSESLLLRNLAAAQDTFESLKLLVQPLEAAARLVGQCLRAGGKLLTCGNGGSAADAAHIATEFVCRFQSDRLPFPAICLNDAASTLTAIGNDYGFEQVFARQVRAFARPGDVLLAFSTSGQSNNVLLALDAAGACGISSIAFLGKDGGLMRGKATIELLVASPTTARIQEAHLLLYHCLCEMVEPMLRD